MKGINSSPLQQIVTIFSCLCVAWLPVHAVTVSQDGLAAVTEIVDPGDRDVATRDTSVQPTTEYRGSDQPPTLKNTRDVEKQFKTSSKQSETGKNRKGYTGHEFLYILDKQRSYSTYAEQQKAESLLHELKDGYHKTSGAGGNPEEETKKRDDSTHDVLGAIDDDEDRWMFKMQSDFPHSSGKIKHKPGMNKIHSYKNMEGYSYEYRIKHSLFHMGVYDNTLRPVKNDSTTTVVYLAMSLSHILNVKWMDEYLTWNPDSYGGVSVIRVPAMQIWIPDILITNFADRSFQDLMNMNAIIRHNGQVLWVFPAVLNTYSTLDVRHFPFDQQKCDIEFISWSYHGLQLDLRYHEDMGNSVYYTSENQEWYVDMLSTVSNKTYFPCCPEPYPYVTFTIHMTRRSLFYVVNPIFPCLLIYAVSFLGFFLPVESGEKVNLEITILLALVVFLLILGETLPPTPDAIPALELLYGVTMLMVAIALVMAVTVTNIFLRKDSGKPVPACLTKLVKPRVHAYLRELIKPRVRAYLRELIKLGLRTCLRRGLPANQDTIADNHVTEMKKPEIEMDDLGISSELEAPNSCRRNRSNTGVKRPSTSSEKASAVEMEMNEKNENDWRCLANHRIFFWLFLFSSIGVLTAVFSQFHTT